MVNIASMKKIYPILYIILITISIYSCKHDPSKDDVDESLIKHELRKFNVKTSIEEKSSGSFFLIFGGYSSSVKEYTNIRFYFKNCLNEYQFVETDIKNVRIKIDTVKIPYVVIKGQYRNQHCYNEWGFSKIVLYCSEKDFQPQININDLK